jgi:MoaA/NifB/PqqE/SkfB family radical SAM enzyme
VSAPFFPVASVRRRAVTVARVAEANLRPLDEPMKLTFALTYWCQYRCQTCNIWQRKPENELTLDEIRRLASSVRKLNWLDITGGEIFLRRDIEDVLQTFAALPNLSLLHFPTNGFLTDRIVEVTRRLASGYGPKIVVTVSVDGDEALNDRIRGIRGGFSRQMATFRALRRLPGIHVALGMTLSQGNVQAVDHTFAACKAACPDLAIEDFHINVAQVSAHYYGNSDGASAPDRTAVLSAIAAHHRHRRAAGRRQFSATALAHKWLEDRYLDGLTAYVSSGEMPVACHALRSTCFIDPFGMVYPCITYSRPLGNLRAVDMDLRAIWRKRSTRSTQDEIGKGQCPQCWTACEAYPSILGHMLRRRQ